MSLLEGGVPSSVPPRPPSHLYESRLCLFLLSASSLRLLVNVQDILASDDLRSRIGSDIDDMITKLACEPKKAGVNYRSHFRRVLAREFSWQETESAIQGHRPKSLVGCVLKRAQMLLSHFGATEDRAVPFAANSGNHLLQRVVEFLKGSHANIEGHCMVYMDSLLRCVFGCRLCPDTEALVSLLDLGTTRSNLILLRLVLSSAYNGGSYRHQITHDTIPWINVLQRKVHELFVHTIELVPGFGTGSTFRRKMLTMAPLLKEVSGALVMLLLLHVPMFADSNDNDASLLIEVFPQNRSSMDVFELPMKAFAADQDSNLPSTDPQQRNDCCLTRQLCTLFNNLDVSSLLDNGCLMMVLTHSGFLTLAKEIHGHCYYYPNPTNKKKREQRCRVTMEEAMQKLRCHLGDERTGGVLGALLRKAQERETSEHLVDCLTPRTVQLRIPRGNDEPGGLPQLAPAAVLRKYDERVFGHPAPWHWPPCATFLNRSLQLMLSMFPHWPQELVGIVCLTPNTDKGWFVPHVIPGGLEPSAAASDVDGDGGTMADAGCARSLYFWVWHEKERMLIPVWFQFAQKKVLTCVVFGVSARHDSLLPKTMEKVNRWLTNGEFRR